jgi:hypothetical protein
MNRFVFFNKKPKLPVSNGDHLYDRSRIQLYAVSGFIIMA